MKLFHCIEADECLGDRRGVIVERDAIGVWAVHLLLSITGRRRQLFLENWHRAVVESLPVYWFRFTFRFSRVGQRQGLEAARGAMAQSGERVLKRDGVPLYEIKPQ